MDNQRSGYTGELIKLIQDKRHTHRTKAVMPLYERTKNQLRIPPRTLQGKDISPLELITIVYISKP